MPDPGGEQPTERRAIIRDGLGVGMATGLYGVSFGAVSVAAGLSVLQTCVLSLVMFTGASQFAFVGVVAAGGAPLSGAVTALMLGTRNTLYGLKLAPLLRFRGWRRPLAAQLVIDESTAMSVTRDSTAAARIGFLSTGLAVFVLWNLFTFLGAIAGNLIGDPRTYGLDAAVGAAFLALLWPRLADRRQPGGRRLCRGRRPRRRTGHAGRRTGARGRRRRPAGRLPDPQRRRLDRDPRAMTWWWAILGAGVGCYLLKLAGLSVPARVLERPLVERIADLIPVALLSALVAVQVFASGTHLTIDARAAGLAVAVVALVLRAPFLVVVVVAALTASLLRVVFPGW